MTEVEKIFEGQKFKIGIKYLRGLRLTEEKNIFKELKINGRGRKYLRGWI